MSFVCESSLHLRASKTGLSAQPRRPNKQPVNAKVAVWERERAMATTQAMLSANRAVAPVAVSSCENSTRSSASPKVSSLSVAGSSIHGAVAGLGGGKWTVGVQKQSTVAVRAAVAAGAETAAPKSQQQKSQYDITTLTTWLLKKEQAGVIDGELTIVLSSIALACKQIASLVQRAGISNMTGLQGAANIQGEDQKKLDVISNEVFSSCLRSSGRTGIIASEEEDVPVAVEESYSGNYIVVFDPLDGSSNIDAAVSTGSIWGIYRPNEECLTNLSENPTIDEVAENCVVNVCQPGSNLLSAGYCMYSSSVILVLSVGDGVYGFTLDPLYGEFVLSHDRIQIPKSGKIYSMNEGNYALWDDNLKKYVDSLKDASSGKPYSARYIGSLVGDFHRTMLYGGIYGYPKDAKSKTGKLRLLYECAPMSYLAEQAGGKGSDGRQRILDIQPEQVHQRVPLYVGSTEEVEKLEKYLA